MKKSTRWIAFTSALALTGVLVGASVAANGDQSDPLVTMSYLDKVVIPQVISKVEGNMVTRQSELEKSFQDQIAQYKREMESHVPNGPVEGSADYELVTLQQGQTLSLDVGCEVMLRIGSITVRSDSNPALVDISTGDELQKNAALIKNHLYMATMADRSLTASAGTVKLLVRGGYLVK